MAAQHVGLAARNVLDLARVGQKDSEAARFEQLKQGDPPQNIDVFIIVTIISTEVSIISPYGCSDWRNAGFSFCWLGFSKMEGVWEIFLIHGAGARCAGAG